MHPEVDTAFGVATGISPSSLGEALEQLSATGAPKHVAAVLVTSPTYYGVCSDVAGLAQVCHERGVKLIVDEAHGAHFGLHPSFPRSAQQLGADVSIQSTHKTLGAMTQAAMLHVSHAAGCELAARLPACLCLLHSTSPSYVLMASLDAAAHAAADPGNFEQPLACAAHIRSVLQHISVPVMDTCLEGSTVARGCDPLRITLLAAPFGMSGFGMLDALEALGCSAEMATQQTVVLALGMGSILEHACAFEHAIMTLHAQHSPCLRASGQGSESLHAAERSACDGSAESVPPGRWVRDTQIGAAFDIRSAHFAGSCRLPLAQSVGRRSAGSVSVYPPGIPVLCQGEVITHDAIQTLVTARAAGGRVVGVESDLQHFSVIDA